VRKHQLRAARWSCPLCAAPALGTFTQLRTVPLSPWDPWVPHRLPEHTPRPLPRGSCVEGSDVVALLEIPRGRRDDDVAPIGLLGWVRAA